MNRILKILIVFIGLSSLNSFANSNFNKSFNNKDKDSKKQNEKLTVLVKWFLPEILKEISGICWVDDQRIACVQDELGIVFIYNILDAKIERQIPFADPGDFESITKSDLAFYVMRADGRIFEITNSFSKKPTVKQYDIPLADNLDFEGFFYDSKEKHLLITFKAPDPKTGAKTKGIYAFDPLKKIMNNKPVYEIDFTSSIINKHGDNDDKKDKDFNKIFIPSDIAINPLTSELYLTDGINPGLLIIDKNGKMKSYFKLDKDDFPQPEGITFSSKGDLFLSTEGVKHNRIIARVKIEAKIKNDKKKKN